MAGQTVLIARFDFDARIDNELTFRTGDRIILLEEHPSGMWKGRLESNGHIGFFPYNFVEVEAAAAAPGITTSAPGITKESWLLKEGHMRKSWKVRWCVLRNREISYYKGRSDTVPAGVINLGPQSYTEPSNKKEFCFCIHGMDRDLFVQFSSKQEMSSWREAVDAAIAAIKAEAGAN